MEEIMKLFYKTALCSLGLLAGLNAYAKKEIKYLDPRCTCTFGLSQPIVKEIVHDYFLGEFTIQMSTRLLMLNRDSIKSLKDSGIVECVTQDLDALINSEAEMVSVTFRAIELGKVLLYSETVIEPSSI